MSSRYLYLLCISLLTITYSSVRTIRTAEPTDPEVHLQDIVFGAADFAEPDAPGLSLIPQGLTANIAQEGIYTSPVTEAPILFNALVPQWKADLTEDSSFLLEVRTGLQESDLGQWVAIQPSEDWTTADDDDVVGDMLIVGAEEDRHAYMQYRVHLGSTSASEQPLLRELKMTFIDSTAGLSTDEMIRQQEQLNRSAVDNQNIVGEDEGYPKPFVISRDIWCTDPACNYTDGLTYHPVTHLILHHTVSSTGADGDSAAVVRAIWAFHTSGRGWRDIGYNYLVDPKGVIYEGHLGGDDVVGIHASGANTGSMALAAIGTYSTTEPSAPMIESAVNLFAWKADQEDIDVFDASNTLPGIKWGLPHLMGHRDVYGTTECPGGAAHALIPMIRDEVARRIGLESPHIYIDELSSSFTKSNANWYDGPLQCGHNAHSWYTYSTTDPAQSANWGEWRLDVPESGEYQIEVYAPYCNTGRSETTGAPYSIDHADGTSTMIVNQDEFIGLWTSIGQYRLLAGGDNIVRLNDLTTTDEDRGVWFDAVRLLPLEVLPSVTINQPGDGTWQTSREVVFDWQIDNPEKAQATVLQVATDEAFEDRIVNEIWTEPVLSAALEFEKDYADLYWRVVVTSESNNEYSSSTNHFGIDTEPPESTVTGLRWLPQNNFYYVSWKAKDDLSGVKAYSIDYREAGSDEESWESWLSDVSGTSAFFTPPEPETVYELRVYAVDNVGNQETPSTEADIDTDQALILDHAVLLPMVGHTLDAVAEADQ